jgi:hypothetical protein
MPSTSKAQQRLMGIVHAIQKGEADPKDFSKSAQDVAASMSKSDVKDFASTKHKGLPDKKEENITSLKEYIRKMVREMNATGNVQGYATPYAFGKKGSEKAKGKKQADLTGYTVVNEMTEREVEKQLLSTKKGDKIELTLDDGDKVMFQRVGVDSRRQPTFKALKNDRPIGRESALSAAHIKSVKMMNENRWLELRNEEVPTNAKIDKGISNINKQLAEMEKFLNWYGRLKQENGVTNDQFWKRTNRNIYSIKERLIKLEQKIRKISE